METTNLNIGGVMTSDSVHWHGTPKAGGSCTIKFANEEVHFYWSGEGTGDTSTAQPTDNPNDTEGHFNGVKQGTLYKASDGSLYIMKYDDKGWCKSPETVIGNWQKITQ